MSRKTRESSVGVPLLSDVVAEDTHEEEETTSDPLHTPSSSYSLSIDDRNHTVLPKLEIEDEKSAKSRVNSSSPTTPTSANEWTNSASEPLLVSEEIIEAEDEKPPEAPRETEEKKSFITAEHKIAFSHFLRIFTYSTWNDKAFLAVAAAASVLTGITLPIMNVVFGQLVGTFSAFYNPDSGETEDMFVSTVDQNVLYMLYLFGARLLLDYVSILGFRMVSLRISAAMRLAYLDALFKQPISVLDTLPPGQTAAILTITTNILQFGISEKLATFLQSVTLVVTAVIIAFYYNWILTLITSTGLVFIVIFYSYTIPKLVAMLKQVEHADTMSSSVASEVFASIRMVAACGAESKMALKYAAWVQESRRRGLLMSPLVAIQQAPVFFAIHATFALSFWFAIEMYLGSWITSVTTLIIVLMSIMTIVMSIGSISAPVSAAAAAAGSASILFSIIDAPKPKTSGIKYPEVSSQEDIVLENINFAYPLRPEVKVLDDLNICFPAGKLTAIVGASGSGKSTIVGLIERWYEMDGNTTDNILTLYFRNGNITVGGQKLHEIDLKWWRSQIGLVQQEPFLFNDTIYKNVEYGLIGTQWEHASRKRKRHLVRRACKEAFADEFISRLPEGYNTSVGNAGIQLSGGQRQRLAIARSIVKQPKILILDEATSAIDVRGEKIVQAALDKVSKNRTTIMIAHRLSTIMKADNIVVLKKGKVVQQGTHEELLGAEEGPYWALANAQKLSTGSRVAESKETFDAEGEYDDETKFERVSLDDEIIDSGEIALGAKTFFGSFWLFLWEQRPQWRWYSLMLFGTLGAGASFPIHAFLFAKLISLFNFWGQYLQDQTNFWSLMFIFLAIGVGISYYILGWSSNTVSFNITATYRQEYFQNILKKPISYHDSPENSTGALTSLIATDPTQLQQLLGLNMAIVLISLFNILGSIILSFFFGFKLTLLTLFTAMPIILLAGFLRLRYETQFEKMNQEVFKESSKFATESIGAFRTVSSLVLEESICGRYRGLLEGHVEMAWKRGRWSTFVFAMSDSVAILCMAFVLWYGGQLLASHEYAPFNYLVVYLAVVQGSTSAGQSFSFGPNIAQAFAAATRIQAMRPTSTSLFSSSERVIEDLPSSEKGVKIELKGVSFTYPTRDVPVLQGVDMTILPGQFAAIVGPSGSGKTSIISLLERFYIPTNGQILFNSTPINNISLASYRSALSLVSQESSLFSGTITDNILLGVNEDEITDAHLHSICKEAELHDFIISLPEGYETSISALGTTLSGGQRQRLSIARSLIRNPSLLLLDEATSALDSETEASIQKILFKKKSGRTTVAVAHRLATVQNADMIFVMGEGRVVEKGTHGELCSKKGVYWEMCRAQALDQ